MAGTALRSGRRVRASTSGLRHSTTDNVVRAAYLARVEAAHQVLLAMARVPRERSQCGSVPSRFVLTRADEQAVKDGCYFDLAAAEHVEQFFAEHLRHSNGAEWAGKPFHLSPWQREDVIYPLFGWMLSDGRRRFRRAYIEVPKKNGKSTLAAGIGLYLLVGDGEPGAKILSAATTRAQAG